MLAKASLVLSGAGAIFLLIGSLGTTCFNGRWYNHHWVQEWTWAYGLDNKKAGDCAVSSAVFGCIGAILAIAAYGLLILDFGKLLTMIAYAAAGGCALVTLIPVAIIVSECDIFQEYLNEYHEGQAFWVPYVKRTWVNQSTDYSDWFFSFWEKQMLVAGGKSEWEVRATLSSLGSGFGFDHPISMYWDPVTKRFHEVIAWGNTTQGYFGNTFDCVVDFRDGHTIYQYGYGNTREVCATLKAKVEGECFSYWSEKRLTEHMQETCEAFYDTYEGRTESTKSAEAWNAYYNKVEAKLSSDMLEEGLATLYLSNAVFLGFLVSGILMAVGGVVLLLVSPGGDASVNDTKLIPE